MHGRFFYVPPWRPCRVASFQLLSRLPGPGHFFEDEDETYPTHLQVTCTTRNNTSYLLCIYLYVHYIYVCTYIWLYDYICILYKVKNINDNMIYIEMYWISRLWCKHSIIFLQYLSHENNDELYKLHTWIDNAASLWADTDIATGDLVPNPLDVAAVRVMFTYVLLAIQSGFGLGIPISVG